MARGRGALSGLVKRHDPYYARKRAPGSLRPIIGTREWIETLGTANLREAAELRRELEKEWRVELTRTKAALYYVAHDLEAVRDALIYWRMLTCPLWVPRS